MKINGINNSPNFGWNGYTHKRMVETAIKDMPQFDQYKDVLGDYVQRPDIDDIGFMANKHFYFGEKIKGDSFSKKEFEKEPIEKYEDVAKSSKPRAIVRAFNKLFNTNGVSFMDFNGRNNAKFAYQEQIDNIDDALADNNILEAIKSAGRACHFIQDMAQPHHTQEKSVFGKAIDLKEHVEYENYAEKNTDTFIDKVTLKNNSQRKDSKIFSDTFRDSYNVEITEDNEQEWENITQKQFDIAVQATKDFLQNVSNKLGLISDAKSL